MIIPILIFIFIILIYLILIYLLVGAKILRPLRGRQMKKLSEELGMEYIKHDKKYSSNRCIKKHIIQGKLYGQNIEIFDFDSYALPDHNQDKDILYNILYTLLFNGSKSYFPIYVTYINGKVYKDRFLPYLSTHKIKKLIKQEINIPEYNYIHFNKGVFFIVTLTCLVLTSVVGYYFYLFYPVDKAMLFSIYIIINIFFIYLSSKIAKITGYKIIIKNDPRKASK